MDKLRAWLTNPKVLLVIAVLLVILNFIDGGFSFWAIYVAQIAYEANPIMAALMAVSPYVFLVFKVIVPTIASYVLYKYREQPIRGVKVATWILWASFFLYVGLMVHFGFLLQTAMNAGFL